MTFDPITFPVGTPRLETYSPGTNLFTIPADGTIWAGVYFHSTTSTQAQVNDLGQGLYDPPIIGSSKDSVFVSTDSATNASNPDGNFATFFGSPVANLGWKFTSPCAGTVECGSG